MSGLEPIAALGLACNILQLVELGCQTINRIKNVYQGRSLDIDLDENAAALGILSDEVKKASQPGRMKYEKVLLGSAEKCFTAAQDLREEVRFLLGNAKQGSLASALKVASKVTWRKRRLERLKGSLEQAEKQMQSGLLTQIWLSTKAAEIDLNGVRQDLRFFIQQYKDGHRQTADLVSSEGLRTREHISHEAQQTNETIAQVDQKADRIVVLQETQVDEQARQHFLRSLKYPGLNERRNRVADAYVESLKWVYVGDNDDDEASQSNYSYDSDEEPHSLSASYTESESDSESNGGEQSNTKATLLEEADDGDRDLEDPSQLQWNSFSNWLSSTDSIYWISGKPGSGKTTLVKYVLEHEQTRKHLDIWSSGCMLVSHYFWRPGAQMQKSLEGFFFSLLHQLLSSSATALKSVSSSVSSPKDSHTDWSSAELRAAIQTALNAYEHGVCLFVDGIDEIDPQDGTDPGIPEFLDWVFGLSQKEKIKFCLASRPDPHILETSLSKYPRLRLQDLNYQDLMAYAKGHVDVSNMDLSDDVHRSRAMNFVRSLVYKAEGVFLWLIFATRSINAGINNGDSSELLSKRIECLPKGLDNLYQDMWDRVAANNPLEYRQTAALYFKARLRSQERGGLSLLTLVLATTSLGDEIFNALDDPSKLVCQVEMLRKCREVEKKINLYCFGLIEMVPDKHSKTRDAAQHSWYGHKYDSVFEFAYYSRLQFIHRTAKDFLTDTVLGEKVLAFDKLSNFALHYRLVKASLARMVLFTSSNLDPYGSNIWVMTLRDFRVSWQGTDDWVPKDWDNLLLLLEKLFNAGRLLQRFRGKEKVDLCRDVFFLRDMVIWHLDDQFVISRVKDGTLSSNEKSDVLMAASNFQSDPGTFRGLLAAGADPNWQGSLSVGDQCTFPVTPWQSFLINALQSCRRIDLIMEQRSFASTLETIFIFITEGARLDQMVNLAIFVHKDSFTNNRCIWLVESVETMLEHIVDRHQVRLVNLVASVPAHIIVKALIGTIRYRHSVTRSRNRAVAEEDLNWCQCIERACFDHSGGNTSRIFGMVRSRPLPKHVSAGKYSWYEPTDKMHAQILNNFMEAMERPLQVTDEAPIEKLSAELEIRQGRWDLISPDPDTTHPILDDESWICKGEEDQNGLFKRLEKLGVMVKNHTLVQR